MNLFKNTTIRTKRQLMTYITAMTFVFTLTILATSIAGFLVEHLQMAAQENGESLDARKALLFAGLILASASFFGLFVDTFWASLQKKHAPRSLVSAALLGLMVAVGIFLVSHISEAARLIALTLMAAAAYGWSFDLYDVTITSTILRSGKPENTAQNLSQKKVAEAIGMVCGLLLSGLVLFFGSAVAQTLLLGMLFGVLVFVRNFFDRPEDEVPLEFSANAKVPWASVLAKVGDVDGMKAHMSAAPAQVQAEILAVGQRAADEAAQLPGRAAEVLQAAKHEIVELLKRRGEIVHNVHARAEKFSFKQTFGESFQIFQEFFSLFRQDGGRGALVIWGRMCGDVFFVLGHAGRYLPAPVFGRSHQRRRHVSCAERRAAGLVCGADYGAANPLCAHGRPLWARKVCFWRHLAVGRFAAVFGQRGRQHWHGRAGGPGELGGLRHGVYPRAGVFCLVCGARRRRAARAFGRPAAHGA